MAIFTHVVVLLLLIAFVIGAWGYVTFRRRRLSQAERDRLRAEFERTRPWWSEPGDCDTSEDSYVH